jgi:hypothetical protein
MNEFDILACSIHPLSNLKAGVSNKYGQRVGKTVDRRLGDV